MDITSLRAAQADASSVISPRNLVAGKEIVSQGAAAGPSNASRHHQFQAKILSDSGTATITTDEGAEQMSMSQISGFRRTLSHANSLPGADPVPKFGVNTDKESELAEVYSSTLIIFWSKFHDSFQILDQSNNWGMDIFQVGELTGSKALTAITFSIFQVILCVLYNFTAF